jgi:acyl-CoA reductase-like NAD-dependent aldehyde dehydrogenase
MERAVVDSAMTATADLSAARAAQDGWRQWRVVDRVAVIRRLRRRIADRALDLAATVTLPQRSGPAETLTAEVLPLLEACRFLEKAGERLLAPRRLGRRRRPLWLIGSRVEVRREPRGVVLVIGPTNYPLLLPGVQLIQALVAGNAVLLKPGVGASRPARALAEELAAAGLPDGLLQVLGEEVEQASSAITAGVDLVVLTGSLATGRAVLAGLSDHVTPAVMELSGCDPVLVRADADVEMAADALRFGVTLNGGFTCIAPRRVFVHASRAAELEDELRRRLAGAAEVALARGSGERVASMVGDAVERGARVVAGAAPSGDSMAPLVLADLPAGCSLVAADLAAPVLMLETVASDEEALAGAADCPYRLGATVFGTGPGARRLAERVPAGVVVVNDLIVPTADPRVPFGGSGSSGFGVTRGAEGLIEMTVPRTIIERRGRFRPHFQPTVPGDERLFAAVAAVLHGSSFRGRMRALRDVARLGAGRGHSHIRRTA